VTFPTTARPAIAVLGSANVDLTLAVPHLPSPGETVLAGHGVLSPGGKGANQAVAAARLGADVAFAGCVGDDAHGALLRSALAGEGVDVSRLQVRVGTPSGLAIVVVDPRGENSIVVAPGANALVDEMNARAAAGSGAAVLVVQAEIPLPAVIAALALGRDTGVTTVLNLAPVPEPPAAGLLGLADWLVVNLGEAARLLEEKKETVNGVAADSGMDGRLAAARLRRAGARGVVVTMGARGAAVDCDEARSTVPAPATVVVDTTGAGDAFVGAFAVALGRGWPVGQAVAYGCAAGAASTRRPGALPSLPREPDLRAVEGSRPR
jgi:ribokinase